MRLDTRLAFFIALCFFSFIDLEIYGLKISQIAMCGFFPLICFWRKKILTTFLHSHFFRIALLYLILLLAAFLIDKNYLLLKFSGSLVISLLYGVLTITLLAEIKKKQLSNYIDNFMFFIFLLIVIDIILLNTLNFTPFRALATNSVDGYKNHQLMANEPNWLSSFILLIQLARYRLPNPPLSMSRYSLWFLPLLVLNSRIVILLSLSIFIFTNIKSNKALSEKFVQLCIIFMSVLLGGYMVIFLADFNTIFYDLTDFSKNPRLNDFIFLLGVAGEEVGFFSGVGAGGLPPYTVQIPWRETPNIVLNSIFTQFYFEFGLFGFLIIAWYLLSDKPVKNIYITGTIFSLLILHNSFFKPFFWIGISLLILSSQKRRI